MNTYTIGQLVPFKGSDAEIIGKPYQTLGEEWQDAILPNGRKICIPTPAHVERNRERSRKGWQEQREQFRRLGELQKDN